MDAVAAPDGDGALVLEGAALEGGEHQVEIGEQQVGGLGELDRKAGVEHVAAGHAEMDVAALRPDALGEPGQEGDHVVAGFALDGVDALEVGGNDPADPRAAAGADGARGFEGDVAEFGHGLGGESLDFEPYAKAVFRGPDRRHLVAGVARDHV